MTQFFKYHALGNDYLVIDSNRDPWIPSVESIQLICHRHYGIGSDGILYGPELASDGSFGLRIFNPDGSEAEKSGNGIRIFARYLVESGYAKSRSFIIATPGGRVQVESLSDRADLFQVDMGTVSFRSERIPVRGEPREVIDEPITVAGRTFRMTCLSIGNPHCVIPLAELSPELALEIGPVIENLPLFPNRINLQLLQVLDRNRIRIEIWERGAGYTLASGSSSCAAASAAFRLGLVDSPITVQMPGGNLAIEISPDGRVLMTGPVSAVAAGEFAADLQRQLG